MSQQEVVEKERVEQEASTQSRTAQVSPIDSALTPVVRFFIGLASVGVLIAIGITIATGAEFAFPFVYVGTALLYVTGGLYLIKKIIDHPAENPA